jgi:hypothetical protein
MMTTVVMRVMLGFCVLLFAAALWEHRWYTSLYWLGAILINFSILMGGMK